MSLDYSPYVLPTIHFIGGETQELAFNVYFHDGGKAYDLSWCTCYFSVVNFLNKTGAPLLTNAMGAVQSEGASVANTLTVVLSAQDTVNLSGKYIYQISMRDIDGDVEIPKQGILYINNNIHKNFITQ